MGPTTKQVFVIVLRCSGSSSRSSKDFPSPNYEEQELKHVLAVILSTYTREPKTEEFVRATTKRHRVVQQPEQSSPSISSLRHSYINHALNSSGSHAELKSVYRVTD